jgi:predicted AlkP superfamily phosphohydrolase/phosphomutase
MIRKVWVIGLDSAPPGLMSQWMDGGLLPNLARLRAEGAFGVLHSTFPPLSSAAWSSFATGMHPGKHGVLDHGYRRDGTYEIVPTNARRRAGTPVWRLLDQAGLRAGIVNVPETYPPEPLQHGFLITGLDTPSDQARWCEPPELAPELDAAIGGYHVFGKRSKESLDLSLAGMRETIPMRLQAAEYLLRTYDPHLFVLVFMETDWVQHKTWQFMDPGHPQHERYGSAILQTYQLIDAGLPALLHLADETTAILIMSDHGAGPAAGWLHLNTWLAAEGLLRFRAGWLHSLKRGLFRLGLTPTNAFDWASALRLGLVDRAADRVKRGGSMANPLFRPFLSFADVDWSRTRAYHQGGNMTGLWVNLRGREPEGCVQPGAEYEAVRDDLLHRLAGLRDPSNGQQIVTGAWRREDRFQGPYLERIPDVVFDVWQEQYVGFGGQEFAANRVVALSRLFSGCHRRDGLILLHGSAFRPGLRLPPHHIVDLAPTILHLLAQGVPADMDGRVMEAALSEPYHAAHPVQSAPPVWRPAADEAGFSPREREAVADRLRGLGYL